MRHFLQKSTLLKSLKSPILDNKIDNNINIIINNNNNNNKLNKSDI